MARAVLNSGLNHMKRAVIVFTVLAVSACMANYPEAPRNQALEEQQSAPSIRIRDACKKTICHCHADVTAAQGLGMNWRE